MSFLNVNQVNTAGNLPSFTTGANTITFNGSTNVIGASSASTMKNRIINGDMRIDQRNAGALYTTSGSGDYTLDRWSAKNLNSSGVFQTQQNLNSVTPPAGFNYYLGVKPSSSASTTSADCWYMQQLVEGYNVNDLAWGTSSAKPITISFWVYSSVTGTYGGFLANNAANRCYVYSYTINQSNTWQFITVTIPGDTTGTWAQTNGNGLFVTFCFGAGSNYTTTPGSWGGTLYRAPTGQASIMGSTSNVFYFTGVQVEVGSTATTFDFRHYQQELALCQRYFETSASGIAPVAGDSNFAFLGTNITGSSALMRFSVRYVVTKRAAGSTITFYNPRSGGASGQITTSALDYSATTVANIQSTGMEVQGTTNSGGAAGNGAYVTWTASSEL